MLQTTITEQSLTPASDLYQFIEAKAINTGVREEAIAELKTQAAKFRHHVDYLRRRFGGALSNPEDVVQTTYCDVLKKVVTEGRDSSYVRDAFSKVALDNRARNELRHIKSQHRFRDRLLAELGYSSDDLEERS